MLKRDTRWTLVFEDLKSSSFNINDLEDQTNFLEMKSSDNCCIIMNKKGQSKYCRTCHWGQKHLFSLVANCNCDSMTSVSNEIVKNAGEILALALAQMKTDGTLPGQTWNCDNPSGSTNETR